MRDRNAFYVVHRVQTLAVLPECQIHLDKSPQ